MSKELEHLIEDLEMEGWRWLKMRENRFFFVPPIGDPRNNWCAEWKRYKEGYYYPHWIGRNK